MGKFIKFLLLLILSIVLIVIVGAFIVANVVDPNKFKEPIAQQISKQTGRDTSITGDVSWNFFPWLGFSVGEVTMANAEGFGEKPFASIEILELKVKASTLLKGKVQVDTLTFTKPQINLMINRRGKTNWEDLAQPTAQEAADTNSTIQENTSPAAETATVDTGILSRIQINNISLRGGQILFDNQQTKQEFALSELDVTSQNIAIDQEFPFAFDFKFIALEDDVSMASGDVTYQGNFRFDSQTWRNKQELLPSIYLDGKLTIEPLTLDKMRVDKFTAEMQVNNQLINIAPITAKLYQGEAVANLDIKLTTDTPQIKLAASLKDLQAGALFEDLVDSKQITGTAEMHFKLSTRGKTTPAMLNALTGNAQFEFTDGILHGIDVAYLLNWAASVFSRQEPPAADHNTEITEFGSLTGTADIINGVIVNDDLVITAPKYQITGAGNINLVTQAVEYRLAVISKSESESNAIVKMQKSLGGTIPIIVRGEFANLSTEPDLDIIIKNSARSFIEKQVDRFLSSKTKPAEQTEDDLDDNDDEDEGSVSDKARHFLERVFN
jgi:AsmA protein